MSQKIVPNLWFDTQAEEAAEYYCSIFPDARILSVAHYPESVTDKAGQVMTVEFEVAGMRIVGINGGALFKPNEAVSLQINCADQAEVDYYWERLIADGGAESMCGWCKDKYGFSWQVVPEGMDEVFTNPDRDAANRAIQAMFQMRKLDVAALRAAAAGE